jgi:cytoskeletal protein CcmA (bactofilin family)
VIGGGTVNKYGTGTLTLNGAADSFAPSTLNIYTGGVTVTTAGLLDNALNVLIDTPGTLTLLADQTIHDLTGGGTLNVGSNTLHLTDGGSFDGTINGNGQVVVGSGNLAVNNNVTTNTLTLNPGSTVTVGSTGSLNTTNLNVAASTLDLSGTATATTATVTNGGVLHLGNGVDLGQQGQARGR